MLFSGIFFISKQAPNRHELRWCIHVLVPHGFLPCGYQGTLTNKNWSLLKLGSIMEQLLLAARSYPQGEVQVSFEHIMSHACRQSPDFFAKCKGGEMRPVLDGKHAFLYDWYKKLRNVKNITVSVHAQFVSFPQPTIVKSFADSQTRLFGFSCENNDRNTGSFEKSVELAPDKVKDMSCDMNDWTNRSFSILFVR